MNYLCLIYIDEKIFAALPRSERDASFAEHLACDEELKRSGHLIASEALAPAHSAVTVCSRDGKLSVTDGPFAETKEQLGGLFLIDARDLNDAIRVASHIPSVRSGTVEVRPTLRLIGQANGAARTPPASSGARYVCLVCYEEKTLDGLPKAEWDALVADSAAYDQALERSGHMVIARALASVQCATIVRVRGGKLSVTDGPFAETKEQLGGFILIAAKDLDDAIRVAARVPVARLGSVEVRAVQELKEAVMNHASG